MSEITGKLRPIVEQFVSDLEAAFRRSVLDALAATIAGESRAARPSAPSAPVRRAAASTAPAKKASKPGVRVRRSAADLERVEQRIVDYVRKNPGKRGEEIKKALGLTTALWTRPLSRLVERRALIAKGVKRATTYTAK
ncbi:MAG: hypothetical protein HOW73_27210 [Polyangiaceae bacterium]|nr:hypothetical protein [Polyangiaceae bacterium]